MAKFEEAYRLASVYEGKYSNDPDDSGGETWKGIARNRHPHASIWELVDKAKKWDDFPNNLNSYPDLEDRVQSFFKQEFWDAFMGDHITSQAIANELYESGINFGLHFPISALQSSLNAFNYQYRYGPDLAVDGACGPKTIRMLDTFLNRTKNDDGEFELLANMNCTQRERYKELATKSIRYRKYYRGWIKRAIAVREA